MHSLNIKRPPNPPFMTNPSSNILYYIRNRLKQQTVPRKSCFILFTAMLKENKKAGGWMTSVLLKKKIPDFNPANPVSTTLLAFGAFKLWYLINTSGFV